MPLPKIPELLEELRAVRSLVNETIEQVSDETELYIASTRLNDWLEHHEVISFMVTDTPSMLVAGARFKDARIGTILYATREMHRVFRYEPARLPEPGELIGRHVNHLVPPHLRKQHTAHLNQFMAEPRTRMMGEKIAHLQGYTKDDCVFPARVALRPRIFNGRVIALATVVAVGPYVKYCCPPGTDVTKSWSDISSFDGVDPC